MAKSANDFIFKYLATSAGSILMNVDASSTLTFDYTVPTGKTAHIQRVNFLLVDGAMGYGEFGGLGTALANGIKVEALDSSGGTLLDFLDGQPITVNEDFCALAGIDGVVQPAAGDDFLPVRWTLAKAGAAFRLQEAEVLRITLQDDLSNLSHFEAMVQGVYKE